MKKAMSSAIVFCGLALVFSSAGCKSEWEEKYFGIKELLVACELGSDRLEKKLAECQGTMAEAGKNNSQDDLLDISAEEMKKDQIAQYKIDFGLEKNLEEIPDWEKAIRQSKESVNDKFCSLYARWYDFDEAFTSLSDSQEVSWADVGINKDDAESMKNKFGQRAAAELIKIFDLPFENREKMQCSIGEWSLEYSDPSIIMETLVGLLKEIGQDPEKIGTSVDYLRGIIEKDFRLASERLEEKYKKGEIEERYIENERENLRNNAKNWGVTL